MKKLVALVGAAMLMASSASALTIVGSAHDLSAYTGTGTELCVVCHTPHGADTSVTDAPLWNRTNAVAAGSVYSTGTLNAVATITSVNQTDAPLCLSCHNPASLAGALQNPPNSGTVDLSGYTWNSTDAQLGTDMTNDHPIGFDYSAINALDSEIYDITTATGNGVQFFSNMMWCSSCHDVHDNQFSPFLLNDNASSGLCLDCHMK